MEAAGSGVIRKIQSTFKIEYFPDLVQNAQCALPVVLWPTDENGIAALFLPS